MMNPFLYLIVTVLNLLEMALFVWVILGLLIAFNIVNRFHPIVRKIETVLNQVFEPLLRPIRRYVPAVGGIDLSPIVLIILINFIKYAIVYYT